jgi:hypothetical protein
MLTLCRQDSLVSIDLFSLDNEYYICKSRVIDDSAHVSNETIYCLVINFVLLKFTYIENAYIVEPFAPIKTSENE